MNKKIVTFLIALLMIVPAMFAFNGCAGGDSNYKVDNEVWEKQLLPENLDKISAVVQITEDDGMINEKTTKASGNTVYQKQAYVLDETDSSSLEIIYNVEDGSLYRYSKSLGEPWKKKFYNGTSSRFPKYLNEAKTEQLNCIFNLYGNFNDFTYNKDNKSYKVENYTYSASGYNIVANCEFKFENQKLVSVKIEGTADSKPLTVTADFFSDVTIDIPEVSNS